MRQSNRFVGRAARGVVSLKRRIGHVHVVQFRRKEARCRVAVSSAANSRCSTSLVPERVRSDDACRPKSAPNGHALRVRLSFANHARPLRAPNAAISPIDEAIEVKTRFVAYDYLARETSTRFSTINNPFHVVVYAPFLLNSQLFFFQARQPDSMAANSNLALLLVLRNEFS